MATIFDVADWFLSKEAMTPKKLQKLCYYYKAWGLALYYYYDEDLLLDVVCRINEVEVQIIYKLTFLYYD